MVIKNKKSIKNEMCFISRWVWNKAIPLNS